MAEVVNITEELERRDAVRHFARLMRIADDGIAAILADPVTHMKNAGRVIEYLRDEMREAVAVLSGAPEIKFEPEDDCRPPESIGAAAMRRNLAAKAILETATNRVPDIKKE